MPRRRKDTDYLAVSTRVHAMENKLLTRDRMERMIDAKEDSDALKILEECGYPEASQIGLRGLEGMLAAQRGEVFQDIRDSVPEGSLVEVFQLKYDYHNAKVLVKAAAVGADPERLLLSGGRWHPQELLEQWKAEELNSCTESYRDAVLQAKAVLAETGDPQQADIVLDQAQYREMEQLAEESCSDFLKQYVQLSVDVANLRTAVRCARMDKGGEFLIQVLLPGGSISQQAIAAVRGESLKELFQYSSLAEEAALGAELIGTGGGLTEFEKQCDDALTEYIAQAQNIPFGEQVVLGYLYAKEAELTAIRTILTGRMAGLDGDVIRSRLRAAYA